MWGIITISFEKKIEAADKFFWSKIVYKNALVTVVFYRAN